MMQITRHPPPPWWTRWYLRAMCRLASLPPALWVGATVLVALGVLWVDEASARPGGGHSFSGRSSRGFGGRSYSGHGGGDGSALVFLLIRLFFAYPQIGIPVAVAAGIWYYSVYRNKGRAGWQTMEAPPESRGGWGPLVPAVSASPRRQLESLRATDPDFSLVLFEDFVFALYARAHEARGNRELDQLSPYLAENVRERLAGLSSDVTQVKHIIIGAMTYVGVQGLEGTSQTVSVTLEFESNYTEVVGKRVEPVERTYYAVERWTLSRSKSARSRPPEKIRNFGCPSCGAPLDGIRGNRCSFCNQVVDTGEFDWLVTDVVVLGRERRPPALTTDVQEEGTDLPTIVDPNARTNLAAIARKDPAFEWGAFEKRVRFIFEVLQDAWSTREWSKARPYVSDALFQMLQYWIDTYRRAGLRNVTENARITRIQLAAVTSDAYFDAITVRLYATGLDYTITDDGKLVSGSKRRPRPYSEYWTLIRGSGTRGASRAEARCPSCGAPVKVNMAGSCEYCSARLTSGEFDWVLSRIEQDDAYQG